MTVDEQLTELRAEWQRCGDAARRAAIETEAAQLTAAKNAPKIPMMLDWRTHSVGDPKPCRICGKNAIMRDENERPCHKMCAEAGGTQ